MVEIYGKGYYRANKEDTDRLSVWFYSRIIKKIFLKNISNKRRKLKVLDFGCGVGHLTKRLSTTFKCYAFDISKYAINEVKKNAPNAKIIDNINKVQTGSFGGIIALQVLEHIKHPEVTVKKFSKILRSNGLIFIAVPNPEGMGHKLKKGNWFGYIDKTHLSILKKNEWIELFEKEGLNLLFVYGDGLWDVPYLKNIPLFLQKLMFYPPPFFQVFLNKLFIPPNFGECLIMVFRKNNNILKNNNKCYKFYIKGEK